MQEKLEDLNKRESEMKDESIQRQVTYIVRFVYICQIALCFEDLWRLWGLRRHVGERGALNPVKISFPR